MFTQDNFDTFVKGLKYPPNDFQLKVLQSIAFGEGNIVVSALAGSGKTSLLVMLAHLFAQMNVTSVGYLAFNKSIRDELNERLPKPYAAINSHSLGMNILKTENKATKVNTGKFITISKNIMSNRLFVPSHLQYAASKVFQTLCSKVMLNMVDPEDYTSVKAIAEQYSLENVTDPMITQVEYAIKEAKRIWEASGEINFDEMLYWPVILNLEPPKHDFFLVDECQDLNILQQKIAFRSITDKGRMVFVGDQRQAIYAFAGADAASFQNIITQTEAKVLPLNVCYRCPTTHLELARKLVPDIEARPGAPEGIVELDANPDKLPQMAKPGALVMCRLTAPLVSAYFKFIQNKVRAKVMGKDIGAQLISLMEKVAKYEGFRYDKAIEFLERYKETQTMMLMQRENNEQAIENLSDQIETLIVCIQNFDSATNLDMLKMVLEDLFGDQDKENWKKMVTLCTVHRAKGLEAEETFILRPEKMPLVWPDQKESDYQQELNILYVALTRSIKRMVIFGALPSPVTQLATIKREAREEAKVAQKEIPQSVLPLQPALLELSEPVKEAPTEFRTPAIEGAAGSNLLIENNFSPQIAAFFEGKTEAKPVTITPVVISPAPKEHTFPVNKQRAGFSRRVTDALEAMSTGELMQMMGVLEAILEDRKAQNEEHWKELSS